MQEGIRKALPDLMKDINAKFGEQVPNGFEDAWNDYVSDLSQRTLLKHSRLFETIQRAFAMKGRKSCTRAARHALFEFELTPATVPWIRSYADIARDFDCTRAAISAAAKQLPPELPKRSGRFSRA